MKRKASTRRRTKEDTSVAVPTDAPPSLTPSSRHEAERRFVDALASPAYVAYLCQTRYFDSPAALAMLQGLQRWRTQPTLTERLSYPLSLFFLERLQYAEFRDAMKRPEFAAFCEQQLVLYAREYPRLLYFAET
ncbi:hypothetical protein CDCA_CDCA16G4138 [Cyanidium caldarium]|uniref:Mediator of RNA polymerase II transcription subunit 31 n=1 Tax=Cyanidium caldarium TaxID=2771 RepID=A0AAV9J244_CYACA|nr:hypothetical protein CDCA_CDCA16G4138 [Cyanidium caldarium]